MSATDCIWYSPSAVAALRHRSRVASDEITRLLRSCTDLPTLEALRAALNDLENLVIPLLDRLCDSTVLIDGRSTYHLDEPAHRRPPPRTLGSRLTELERGLYDTDPTVAAQSAMRLSALITGHPNLTATIIGHHDDAEHLWSLLQRRIAEAASGHGDPGLIHPLAHLTSTLLATVERSAAESFFSMLALSSVSAIKGGVVIAHIAPLLDTGLLGALGTALATAERPPATLGPLASVGLRTAIEALLSSVIGRPEAAAGLFADTAVTTMIATDRSLDPDTVTEALLAAAAGLGPATMLAQLTTARTDGLSPGAARAAAGALAANLNRIAAVIDAPLVRVSEPNGTVDIGSSHDLGRVLIDVMSDLEARVILGTAVGALREQRLAAALDNVDANGPPLSDVIGGQLADVDAVIDAMTTASDSATDIDQARRASLLSGSRSALLLVGQIANLAVPGARLVVAGITSTTREVIDLVLAAQGAVADDGALTDQLAISLQVRVLATIASRPDLWDPLGLSNVPASLWEEVRDHVRRFDNAEDDIGRARSHADLTIVVRDSVALTAVANSVRAMADR